MACAGRRAYISLMIDDLYSAKLLKLAANMPRAGRLAAPDATATVHAQLLRLDSPFALLASALALVL